MNDEYVLIFRKSIEYAFCIVKIKKLTLFTVSKNYHPKVRASKHKPKIFKN